MKLAERHRKHLRGLGHALKPTVMIGDGGISDGVYAEFLSTIQHHELIKVSVRVGDRKLRDSLIAELCDRSGATLVQRVGNVALLYRKNPDKPVIALP